MNENQLPPIDLSPGTSAPRSPLLMSRHSTALLVVDVQQKLIPHIPAHERLVWNIRRLIDGAKLLGVRALCTEQYPKGLGPTVPELASRIAVDDEKSLFSCRQCQNVVQGIVSDRRHQILVCGIESHVCIQQTALDLISMGLDVWVAVDAVASRYDIDHETALRRMEQNGVTLITTEAALFEWCEDSGIAEFKKISQLVQEAAPVA